MNSSEPNQGSQMPLAALTRESLILRFTAIGVVIAAISGSLCICRRLVDAAQAHTGFNDK